MNLLTKKGSKCNSAQHLRQTYLKHGVGTLLAAKLEDFQPVSLADQQNAWFQCVAEELLLCKACGNDVPHDWYEACGDISPFDNSIRLRDVWDQPAACAVFPLANHNDNGKPGVGHIWIFGGLEHRDKIDGTEVIPSEYGICTVATDKWTGTSWQLAGMMALRALQENNPDLKKKLAADWIITGQVDDKLVKRVELGNKLELALQCNRRWLLPGETRDDLPLKFPGSSGFRLAHHLDTAWNHITGQGIITQEGGGWPKVAAFHSFASGAREPVIASALLTQAEKCQLWHTDAEFSKTAADDIANICCELGVTFQKPKTICSSNMAEAEKQLGEALTPELETGRQILFNVTQGNRLMSYAVHSLAQRFENLFLIYRDLDAGEFEFTLIRYEGGQPVTQTIKGHPRQKKVHWDVLFYKPKPGAPKTWQELLKKIRKTKEDTPSEDT